MTDCGVKRYRNVRQQERADIVTRRPPFSSNSISSSFPQLDCWRLSSPAHTKHNERKVLRVRILLQLLLPSSAVATSSLSLSFDHESAGGVCVCLLFCCSCQPSPPPPVRETWNGCRDACPSKSRTTGDPCPGRRPRPTHSLVSPFTSKNWNPVRERKRERELATSAATNKQMTPCLSVGLLGATPDSRRASITSSSPATGRTNSRPTSVRKGSTSWSGLDPLSAALLSQQREEEDDGDCDDEQDRPGKGSSYHRRRTTLVSQHGDRRPSKAQVAGGSSSLLLHNSDEEWNSFRSHVMSRYTTLQKLSIKSSFLSITSSDRIVVSSGSPVAVVAGAGSSSISDQVKNRLSQLDDVNEGLREERGLTAKEFSDRIEGLKKSLLQSCKSD